MTKAQGNVHEVLIARTHVVMIDGDLLNDNVKEFIFAYGLKQLLNDAGSAAKTPDEKLAMAQKKLEALYEGTLRTARAASGKSALQTVAERMAWEVVGGALRAKGQKLKDVSDETKADYIARYLAKYPETMDKAQAELDARKNAPVIDLDDLLGEAEPEQAEPKKGRK